PFRKEKSEQRAAGVGGDGAGGSRNQQQIQHQEGDYEVDQPDRKRDQEERDALVGVEDGDGGDHAEHGSRGAVAEDVYGRGESGAPDQRQQSPTHARDQVHRQQPVRTVQLLKVAADPHEPEHIEEKVQKAPEPETEVQKVVGDQLPGLKEERGERRV